MTKNPDFWRELEHSRVLTDEEWRWIDLLLSPLGEVTRGILREQLRSASVIAECVCGCRTLDLQISRETRPYHGRFRVPVEMLVPASDGVPILFLLHMNQGYVQELEVLRADGGPLDVTIDLTGATFTLHD